MKKWTCVILAVSLLLAMTAGCSSPPAPSSGGSAATTPAATAKAPAGGAPSGKTSAILATAGEPNKFFHLTSKGCSGDDNLVLSNVYDCLTFLEPDGSLSPGIAESWDISEDGKCYTFHIRKGVKFHDGTDMTAEDVKFTLDLGRSGPLGPALLINYDRSEVVDANTVKVYLSSPYAAFLYGVASRVGGITSKAYFEKVGEDGYQKAPIGTGPYKFISAVSGDTITLEAFKDYWRGEAPVKTIYIKVMTDASTQIIALENGDVDAVRGPSISACTKLDESKGVSWVSGKTSGRITLYLATWRGVPGENLNFRRALQSGVNKEDVNIGVNEGYADIIDIDMCSFYGGHPTGYNVVKFDSNKAKDYLAAANYKAEKFEILTKVGTTLETAARIVQAQFIDIGVNCTVNAVDNATYMELFAGGNYDAIMYDNLCSLVDADGLAPFFMVPETGWVYTQHAQHPRTREVYDLCMLGRITTGDERREVYRKAVDIVTEEVYHIPLYNGINTVAHRTNLGGVEAHCLGTYNFFRWNWS